MKNKDFNNIIAAFAVFVLSLVSAVSANAQSLKTADSYFANNAYYSAANLYRQVVNLKGKDEEVRKRKGEILFRIGECYRKMNKTLDAQKWYAQAEAAKYNEADLYFGMGCVKLMHGQYADAHKLFMVAKLKDADMKLLDTKIASCEIASHYGKINNLYEIVPLEGINTKGSEYGISFYKENLIYASTGRVTQIKKISERTGLPYSDVYIASPDSRSLYGAIKKLEEVSEEQANDGTFCYDSKTKQLYCTRCEADNQNCFILKISVKDNRYKVNGKLKLGNVTYGIGHPYVTDDGNRIYFSSIITGGYGGVDLWYVDRDAKGMYGSPVNLGENINTAGDDVFPSFIDGVLYFASDGHPGMGGLDIFASYMQEDGTFGEAHNLRAPFNTSWDDFNLIHQTFNNTGLFISNRNNAVSSDDIYMFNDFPPKVITLDGTVYDSETKELLKEYTVAIMDSADKFFEINVTDSSNYFVYINPDKNYQIKAISPGYDENTETLSTVGIPNFSDLHSKIYLNKTVIIEEPPIEEPTIEITEGDSVKMMYIEIKDIFYEYNKSRLTEKSKQELDKYVQYFDEYPELVVEIGSHTDSRGSNAYNMKLSEQRAKSVVDYFISKGIDAKRLVWKGYGEEQLLIPDAKTEAEHQANRRTVFKVLTLGLHATNIVIKKISAEDMINSSNGAVDLSGWWVQIRVSSNSGELDLPVIKDAERITGKEVQLIRADDGKNHYCIHYDTRNEALLAEIALYKENIKTILLQF
ncbi:MAG: OmpA family protein [Prevotellaceae bacterium]|jgi:outer membrane protein OmpA-like peptidoglycan-associated protein/tetratricopeptide (TPR) repeat protein|nr:OmpA family protein [Prevotellaceae bacterium]